VVELEKERPAAARTIWRCARHRDVDALYRCGRCKALWCSSCVRQGDERGVRWFGCACGGRCAPIEFDAPVPSLATTERELTGAFSYPFCGEGRFLLALGTVFYWVFDFWLGNQLRALLGIVAGAGSGQPAPAVTTFDYLRIGGGCAALVLVLALFGYQLSWLMRVVRESAKGRDELPGFPEYVTFADSVFVPLAQGLALVGVTLGPGLVLLKFGGIGVVLGVLALAAGAAVLPMALLAVAIADSLEGLDAKRILRSIPRIGAPYGFAAALFAAVIALLFVGAWLLEWIPFLGPIARAFLILYLSAVAGRVLGLVYARNEKRLGWY